MIRHSERQKAAPGAGSIRRTAAASIAAAVALAAIAVTAAAGSRLLARRLPYPELTAFLNRAVSTRILDADGNIIQILGLEDGLHREYLAPEEIPEQLKEVFIAAEDRRFYRHHGVDTGAVLRACLQNLRERRTVSGASTITMQLARMIRPSARRTIPVKLREAWDAVRLEARFSKQELLALYLNNIPFGFNCEGVASAARTFFGTAPQSLTEPELYCLAVIPRRPSLYNPLTNPEQCARAAWELYEESAGGTDTADASVPPLTRAHFEQTARAASPYSYPVRMPHYVRYLSSLPEYGIGTVPELRTTVLLPLQDMAESLINRATEQYRDRRITNGAMLVCDTRTGAILAWIGSADFFDEDHNGQIDGVLTPRQPGSSMKPFLYALALESGWTPASVLPDVPQEFGFEELYAPQNFNNRYSGPVRLRVALASSLNIPAVWLLNTMGMSSYRSLLSRLQFQSLAHSDPGLGLALGNAEVSLFELVQAFSIFPRDGIFVPLTATGTNGAADGTPDTTDSAGPADSARIFSADTARLICSILSDADARAMGFGYSKTFVTPFPCMFKTGTANQFQNITALGATPLYTAGVWMGNFSGETVLGTTGSAVPAQIVHEVLAALHGSRGQTAAPSFKKPGQYRKSRICQLSGMAAGPFCPNTVEEYLPLQSIDRPMQSIDRTQSSGHTDACTWHTAEGTFYPAQYAQWFHLKERSGSINHKDYPLTILSPRNRSVFVYDGTRGIRGTRNQDIVIEAAGGAEQTAELTTDGQLTAVLTRPFRYALPLTPGTHTVSLTCGSQQASVSFTVR